MENQNNQPTSKISDARMELIGSYADAAGCLYGALSISEFIDVFNVYEDKKTDEWECVRALRQYLSSKPDTAEFSLYEDYITGPDLIPNEFEDDIEKLRNLRAEQRDKPRYMPAGKDELLRYADGLYFEPKKPYSDLKAYILKNKLQTKIGDVDGDMLDLLEMIQHRADPVSIIQYFIDAGYPLHDIDGINAFLQYVMTAGNNTRLFENNGFTPEELRKINDSQRPEGPVLQHPKKVGRNDPCPCGSGKKYKMCCALIEASGAAQLSRAECKLFYETWYKLLDYVNRKLKVVDYSFSLSYPSPHDEVLLHKIRERLWETPALISDFIADAGSGSVLSEEEINLLQSWEKYHIKGQFVLLKYKPDAAIFMRADKGKAFELYAVKGMTSSIAEAMRRQLPIMLETILLPFKDKIIYDSLIDSHAIEFGGGVMDIFESEYVKSEKKYGIKKRLV